MSRKMGQNENPDDLNTGTPSVLNDSDMLVNCNGNDPSCLYNCPSYISE